MIARPSTEKVLVDCARELMEGVLPHLDDEMAKVRVVMLEQVLRNAAVRAAHEIAWMAEESAAMLTYATAVQRAAPGDGTLAAAVAAASPDGGAHLHLDDAIDAYRRVSEALSCAIGAALATGDAALVAQGEALLGERCARERVIMCGWGELAGR